MKISHFIITVIVAFPCVNVYSQSGIGDGSDPDGPCGFGTTAYYRDSDNDGYGNPNDIVCYSSSQPGFTLNDGDCNDNDASIKPGATEINDGKDNNCDGIVDNGEKPAIPGIISVAKFCDYTKLTRGTPPTGITWYWQSSSTGVSITSSSPSINRYSGSVYYLRARDNSTLFWSDARSVSYTIDQPSTWYADADADGYGSTSVNTSACSQPAGYVSNNSDCNDGDAAIKPGSTEINDGKDNNCDGTIDNGTKPAIPGTITVAKYCDYTKLTRGTPPTGITWYWQSSSGGVSTSNSSLSINRSSGTVYYLRARNNSTLFWSDARSVSYTIDQSSTWYVDADGDGYGNTAVTTSACSQPAGYVSNDSDCNDGDAAIKPGATEINDGKDNNCDGTIDNGTKPAMPGTVSVDNYCDYTTLTRGTPPTGITWYWQGSSSDSSLDNSNLSIDHTTGTSYYLRARDNSTLFWSDARSVSYTVNYSSTWYADYDGDGLGDASIQTSSCTQPSGYVSNNSDTDPHTSSTAGSCTDPAVFLSNENYVFTRSYQKQTTVSNCENAIDQVTYFDGLGRPKQQITLRGGGSAHPSIISTNSWNPGSGSAPFFNQNGATSENSRVLGTGPFGQEELLWFCGNDASSNADGGWNTDYFPVDKNAGYRYSVWVRRVGSQDGTTYHGTKNVNNLSGTENNNPYFWAGDMPTVGEWYLLVGVIHPYTYGGSNSGISGVYDSSGNKVQSGNDFKWRSTTTTTQLRNYLYYATNTGTRQYFWEPVFQKLDGRESSISELIEKAGKADIVTHIEYDSYGRQTRDYLPVPMEDGSFGSYRTADMPAATASYYLDKFAQDFAGMTTITANPYSEKLLEASPLNRLEMQAAPGSVWRLGGGHEIEVDYLANDTLEVRLYKVLLDGSYTPTLSQNTGWYYNPGELYKTVTRDENHENPTGTTTKNHTTETFKNKQGQVVLKRTYNAGAAHDTYYVYDNYGNLTYVLPPKANSNDGISQVELDELCYQYRYDYRNRLVEKKIPGKGDADAMTWESIVYNKLDQPILSQDPNLRVKSQWLFTKYDAFGRVVYTGIWTRDADRVTLQAEADAHAIQYEKRDVAQSLGATTIYYSNNAYPNTLTTSEIHTQNYYDTYLPQEGQAGITIPTANSLGEVISTQTKTLPTVSKVLVLGTTNWITTLTGYDKKGRGVWTKSINPFLGTTDVIESDLDFVGKVLKSKNLHSRTGHADITITDTYSYDHMGRLLDQKQQVNSNASELIARNTYDEIGQLAQQQVGGIDQGVGLQQVDYSYNVRGWLTGINDPGAISNDLFSFGINYNTPNHGGTPLFNGNIAETTWKTQSDNVLRWYAYDYDDLNRITSAIANSSNYNLSTVAYDKNGNITNLTRQGAINELASSFGNMDVLSYVYHSGGNRLKSVSDSGSGTYGFKNGANLTTEYSYDTNGNLTSDLNKGIQTGGIKYNHLNLPTEVKFNNSTSQVIKYTYDATGVKLRKEIPGKIIDYAGNFIYEGGTLQFFNHPEGYVSYDAGQFNYVYNYKDHLGNVRLSYTDANQKNSNPVSLQIIQEKNYYPFGLAHQGYNGGTSSLGSDTAKRYGFGGKELQDENISGNILDWYDFHARNYDAVLGRWMNVDPLAEEFYEWSPYNYTYNNPLSFIDPTGMGPWIPDVADDGSVSYIKEEGDNASTLASQYNLDQKLAENLYSTMENGKISGEKVAKANGGNQILTLDLISPEGKDEQRRFDQHLFASDFSKAHGQDSYHPSDFYSNRLAAVSSSWGGSGDMYGTATVIVDGQSLELDYSLTVYNSNKYADRNAFEISAFASYRKQSSSQRFPGDTGLLDVYKVLPNGKATEENIFTIKDSKSDLYLKRMNRTFSEKE